MNVNTSWIERGAEFVARGKPSEVAPAWEKHLRNDSVSPRGYVVIVVLVSPEEAHTAVYRRESFADFHPVIAQLIRQTEGQHPGSDPIYTRTLQTGEEFVDWIGPWKNAPGGNA